MPDIPAIIRERAAAYGVNPDYLLREAQVESGLNPAIKAKTSSATGLFQILTKGRNSEWAQYGNGADPTDPYANADVAARLARDKGAALQAAGLDPSPGNLYLAHFAGTAGATKVLNSDPATPIEQVLSPDAIKANSFLKGMTAGDLRSWAGRKMGGIGSAADASAPPPTSTAAPGAAPVASATPAPSGPGAVSSPAAPGILNGGGAPPDLSNDPNMQQLFANAQSAMAPPPAAAPPVPFAQINTPIPPGLNRARLLAAMNAQPVPFSQIGAP